MANKDGTGNALEGIKNVLIVAAVFAPMVYFGTRLNPIWWAMTLAGLAGGVLAAKIVTKGSWVNLAGWGGIGAVAGYLFYLAT